jgi:hypothetical protein
VRGLPDLEWDTWRVYVAGKLGLAVDDVRRTPLGESGRTVMFGAAKPAAPVRDAKAARRPYLQPDSRAAVRDR